MAAGPSSARGHGREVGELGPLGPAVIAVRGRLRREIDAGELAPGQRLGAEREIAQRLGVSRSTVRAALADMERSGSIRRVRGRAAGSSSPSARSSVISRALRDCPPTCVGRGSSPTHG